jgi:glycosyltransferase involved in cell wall biosynthesis
VRLLGARSDLPDLFAASDLAVHTSILPEPFGLVVLEAMLQGLPVIGPREGSIPTLVRDGVDGVLVPPRDAGALSAAVLALLGTPEARRAMGRAASARVRESFDVKSQARKLEAIYERALSGAT